MARDQADVCLVVPPSSAASVPALGCAILAAACRERGIGTRVVHANLLLAERMGLDDYRALGCASVIELIGERAFRAAAWPAETLAAMDEPLPPSEKGRRLLEASAPHIDAALDAAVAQIAALAPRIVALSSTFQQNLAAIAITRRVRAALPHACIVIGGANVMSPMGEALAEVLPWVDHFFSGEADTVFPDFCAAFLADGTRPAARVIHCPAVWDMRNSASPDFGDYFEDLRAVQARGGLPGALPSEMIVEFARGCWWGAKHHCTFCGLNGETMAFREKPAARALDELDTLVEQWGVNRFWVADNILSLNYFREMLPVLAARETGPELFFEVKANLSEAQIAQLAAARVIVVQPGIESLSTPVLRLMRKGVSAHQNLMTMRDAATHGVIVGWNLLHGFPGERAADYEGIAALIPAIEHLRPPEGFPRIVIDRFSPNFNEAEAFGIGALHPAPGYRGLYPAEARLDDIAYHFHGSYETELTRDAALVARVKAAVTQWREAWEAAPTPELRIVAIRTSGAVIVDTRRIAATKLDVIPLAALALLRRLERPRARTAFAAADQPAIEALLARRYLVEHEGLLLSVVTRNRALALPEPMDAESDAAA